MSDMTNISVQLDEDDMKKLKKICEQEKETQANLIRKLIRKRYKMLFTRRITSGFAAKLRAVST